MPKTIDLPSGGTATILDVREFKSGEMRRINVAMGESRAVTNSGLTVVAKDAAAAQSIIAWSLPYLAGAKVPRVDPDTFDRLDPKDYAAVLAATEDYIAILYPPPATPDDSDVPGSPTEPTDD